jgi:hypothetical protein
LSISSTNNESQGIPGPAKWTLKRHPRLWDLERPTQFPCLDCSEWPCIRLTFPKSQKNPESLSLPKSLSPNKILIPFCGLLYSSPDVPNALYASYVLPHMPPDFATKFQRDFKSLLASTFNTKLPAKLVFFSFYYCHPVLGLIVMVGWISLIGREGTLAQVCFPEFGAVRKDVIFEMLQWFISKINTLWERLQIT